MCVNRDIFIILFELIIVCMTGHKNNLFEFTDFLKSKNIMEIPNYDLLPSLMKFFNVTKPTAERYMRELVLLGLMEHEGMKFKIKDNPITKQSE